MPIFLHELCKLKKIYEIKGGRVKWRSLLVELANIQCAFSYTCLVLKTLLYSPKAPWEESEWWAQKQEINIGKQPGKKYHKDTYSKISTLTLYYWHSYLANNVVNLGKPVKFYGAVHQFMQPWGERAWKMLTLAEKEEGNLINASGWLRKKSLKRAVKLIVIKLISKYW